LDEGPSENATDNVSPEQLFNGDGACNVATAMALQLATLLLLLQRCWCYALQHCCCNTIVAAPRRCWCRDKLLQRYCNNGIVARQVAAAMVVLLQRYCCSALRR